MYATILLKSFLMHKSRFVLPTIALLIGVSVGSALVMVTLDVEDEIAGELRAFGPNLVVVPKSEDIELNVGGIQLGSISETKYISEKDALMIRELPLSVFGDKVKGILGKNAFVYSIVRVDGDREAILGGTWFEELMKINVWWELEGDYPADNGSVVVGADAARSLGKTVGDRVVISYSEIVYDKDNITEFSRSREFIISGVVETGSDDDSRIFGSMDAVQNLTNKEGKVNIMHISALCNACPVEDVAFIIEQNIPGIDVRTVKQVAGAEMDTLMLVKNLVGLMTVVALGASVLAVMTTMSLSVVERRKEIALMKTVGAQNIDVIAIIFGEGSLIAIIAGLLGFGLGAGIAQLIGIYVFESTISIRLQVIALSLLTSFLIVILASIVPMRMAMKVDPAIVMRGD